MSSFNASHTTLISLKLGFLEKQRDELDELCKDVTKVLSDGKAWMDSGDGDNESFQEINKKIEDMMMVLLSTKGHSRASTDSGESPKQLSQQEMLPMEGASATQPQETSTVAGNMTRSEKTNQTCNLPVANESVKEMMSRLHVAEIAISSLQNAVDKSSVDQTEIQTKMEKMRREQSQAKEDNSKQLADIEKKVKKMEKHSEGMKQVDKRVTCLEKEMNAMKQIEERVTTLESDVPRVKMQEKKLTSLENQMASQLHDLEEKTLRKIDKVEKLAEVNTDMTYHVKSRMESMDNTVQDLSTRMDEHSKTMENIEVKTRKLSKNVSKNEKTAEQKLADVKTEYKLVCHMVANRLLPLERLRTILNQKIKGRDENVKKLLDTMDKVTDLEKKVSDLGKNIFNHLYHLLV